VWKIFYTQWLGEQSDIFDVVSALLSVSAIDVLSFYKDACLF